MSAQTEHRLDGHKIFAHQEGKEVVIHAVTDGRPLTRLVYKVSSSEAREIAKLITDAALHADDSSCQLGPEPGRHVPDDEYIDTEQCTKTSPHQDHYWSTEDHEHEGVGWVCHKYCEGIDG